MQQLTPLHVVGLLATIALIIGIGIYSGRKVKSAADFSSGGSRAGAWIVCGAIMGTLVSGQATIGTAQLAFSFGMSAWSIGTIARRNGDGEQVVVNFDKA